LDEAMFDVPGLTVGEREAVVNLVRARLEKAKSISTTKERSMP
jgi:hypothetical protein